MLPFPRRVFKISVLKLKLWKRHENTQLSKYSICKENDNENSSSKYYIKQGKTMNCALSTISTCGSFSEKKH